MSPKYRFDTHVHVWLCHDSFFWNGIHQWSITQDNSPSSSSMYIHIFILFIQQLAWYWNNQLTQMHVSCSTKKQGISVNRIIIAIPYESDRNELLENYTRIKPLPLNNNALSMGHAHVILISNQIIQLGVTAGDSANWVAWQTQINDRFNRCSQREKVNWSMLIA